MSAYQSSMFFLVCDNIELFCMGSAILKFWRETCEWRGNRKMIFHSPLENSGNRNRNFWLNGKRLWYFSSCFWNQSGISAKQQVRFWIRLDLFRIGSSMLPCKKKTHTVRSSLWNRSHVRHTSLGVAFSVMFAGDWEGRRAHSCLF